MPHRLPHRQLGRGRFILPNGADPGTPLPPAGGGVPAQHRDLTRVPAPVTLEDLHRGALARPVGPPDPEPLTVPDAQVNAVRRGHRAVALAQPAHPYRFFRHGHEPDAAARAPGTTGKPVLCPPNGGPGTMA
ncbi:hypothetical protein Shyhy02_15230 [Streptomyces hygroscopicus subsp. hygroscopicus]|nr:hypothetical protein Shyhy02_15230 [Streptomyces hygroscopicus subsp. hygroscopicus]